MAITRGPISADSVAIVPSTWLRDVRLSFDARGLLAYLAACSLGDVPDLDRLLADSADDKAAICAALVELVDAGYLVTAGDWLRFGDVDSIGGGR